MLNWFKKRSRARVVHPTNDGNVAGHNLVVARAVAALNAGDLGTAAVFYRQALSLQPNDPDSRVALSVALIGQAAYVDAKTELNRVMLIQPANANVYYLRGRIAQKQGDIPGTIELYKEALELRPAFEAVFNDLAAAHLAIGDNALAKSALEHAVSVCENSAILNFELGVLHVSKSAFFNAEKCFRRALLINPRFGEAHRNLGVVLQSQGHVTAAIASFEQALSSEPGLLVAHSNLLWVLSFEAEQGAGRYLQEARLYGEKVRALARPYVDWLTGGAAAEVQGVRRRLRVGLVSGDLWTHPVGIFLEGVLSQLSAETIELVAYSMNQRDDKLTERIKKCFVAWTPIVDMSDEQAASVIHADRVDVLIDLAGHSGRNRLPLFAWKPAPLQVSWLGYLASTGVPGMDYVLADRVAAPEVVHQQFTEKVWCLPETFNCFTPPPANHEFAVAPLPALRNAHVTFCSFQRINKLGDRTLALWGRILQALPRARLRLRNSEMDYPLARDDLLIRLAKHGIAAERVTLAGRVPNRDDFLVTYSDIDIVLDTVTYPGTTSTCEALWMGVPTLTLAGTTMLQRVGASLLTCAGLPDWVAGSADEYVALAVRHGSDIEGLQQLRARLRQQVAETPLFAAARFAPQLEAALVAMWERQSDERMTVRRETACSAG